MSKSKEKHILKAYRIRNTKTGLFKKGGMSKNYSKMGKTWSSKGAIKSHMTYDPIDTIVELVDGKIMRKKYYAPWRDGAIKTTRQETIDEWIERRFSLDDEVIEILVRDDLQTFVNRYPIKEFING